MSRFVRSWNSVVLVLVVLPCFGSMPAVASTFEPMTTADYFERAELIAQTEVLSIENRSSTASNPGEVELPHTFVTFRLLSVYKGSSTEADRITLRFIGGPTADGKRTLGVSGVPQFRVGERDILFIRGNEVVECPLLRFEYGRFRVVRGQLYDNLGREVWLDPNGSFLYGPTRIDVTSSDLRDLPIENSGEEERTSLPTHSTTFVPTPGSWRADAAGFGTASEWMLTALAAHGRLKSASPVRSANPAIPFSVAIAKAVAPPVAGRAIRAAGVHVPNTTTKKSKPKASPSNPK